MGELRLKTSVEVWNSVFQTRLRMEPHPQLVPAYCGRISVKIHRAILIFAAVCLIAFGFEDRARASTVTYQFGVNATTGPLAGASATGIFSYDSSIIPSVGSGILQSTDLFTFLNFTWHGIHYNQTTANTGWIGFANGAATTWAFGS